MTQIGQSIGHYKVAAKLGAGGMGEVYRATDTKLGRDVALKVLPEAFAQDAQRMQRFQREAQVLAALNHPHIATIHGLEESGATRALVMELVEGPTLAERIARGPLPLDEALPIARQMAEALEYAHEHGIIHRDLKPANIKLTPEGSVKVLDFGLAKAMADDPASGLDVANSPTLSLAATKAGVILGTAAYMSPEQAKGKSVDRRADIWAFGVVLYEMLTGRTLYAGETMSETMAAVILKEPALDALPATVPPHLRHLLARCLRKDPKSRLRDIGDARVILEEGASAQGDAGTIPAPAAPAPARGRSAWPWATAALLLVALAIAAWGWWRASRPVPQPVTRFSWNPHMGAALALDRQTNLAFSADGTRLAYVLVIEGQRRIHVRALDQLAPSAVAGTESASNPVFSPDGQWIAFVADGSLKKVQVSTGTSLRLGDAPDHRGIAWLPDDSIVFSPQPAGGLFRIPAQGGVPQPLTTLDESKRERTHRWPHALPGGRFVLFTVGTLDSPEYYDDSKIEAVEVATGQRQVVLEGASIARYLPATGHLLYSRGGSLFAVPFDPQTLQPRGTASPVLQGVMGERTTGAVYFAISDNGSLAYFPGPSTGEERAIVRFDRQGKIETLPVTPGAYGELALSAANQQMALAASGPRVSDIWTYDLRRNTLNRLTFGPGVNVSPLWTPDGRRVVFLENVLARKYALSWKAADGSGAVEKLFESDVPVYPDSFSPDGKWLALSRSVNTQTASDVVLWSMTEGKLQALVETPADEFCAEFSPDGRWITYQSGESGRFEVYVRPASATGGRWQVSNLGGEEPRWSPDGKEIFFRLGTQLMKVQVDTKDGFRAGTPERLFANFPYPGGAGSGRTYAVSPDGKYFYTLRSTLEAVSSVPIVVVVNWAEELRALTSAGKQ